MDKRTLSETFHQYFELVPATTLELREQAFKIRYEVYCEELRYEDPDQFPEKLEQDCFDQYSLQYLLRHKQSQKFAACVRLAMVNEQHKLPFETVCGDSLYLDTVCPDELPANSCAEISRLAVRSTFRQRSGERNKPYSSIDIPKNQVSERRTNYPLITYGLYLACFAGSLHHKFENIYVMMEPRLARRLRILGVQFEQIGLPVEHRGLRAPYRLFVSSAYVQLENNLQQLISDMRLVLEKFEPPLSKQSLIVYG